MNLKRLTGRSRLPDCEGDPVSTGGTTRLAVAAALLAGAMFLCGPAFAVPAAGDGAIPLAAAAPSTCTNVAAAAAYPVADDPEAPPPLKGRVTDITGVLSVACASELTDRLADLERRLGVQMAILLVGSTGHATIEQFATAVFEKWRLGQSKIDNGLLLVAALNDRTVRIEVGYGLEGAIPDVVAGRIIRERIVPAFREKRIEAGVSDAVDALVREMTPPQMAESESALSDEDAQRATSHDVKRLSNGLREKTPVDLGSFSFWLLLGLTGVALGVVTEWRKLRWRVMLPASFLVATIVPVAMLPVGAIFDGDLVAMLGGLGIATSMGFCAWLLGIGLVRSARVRKNTAIIGVTLLALIWIGHRMGYSPGQVLLTVFCVVMGILVIVEKLTGSDWSSSSSTSSSSSFKWPSSGSDSSSSSSSDSFTGGGGSSGGGGASGRW